MSRQNRDRGLLLVIILVLFAMSGSRRPPSPNGDNGDDGVPATWEGIIPQSAIGMRGLDFFRSSPAGWSIVFSRCGMAGCPSSGTNGCDRWKIAMGPGGTPAILMDSPAGCQGSVRFDNSPLGDPGAKAARVDMDLFLPPDWQWPGGIKMLLGLWGGTSPVNASGGIDPSRQNGWTCRMETGSTGPRLYSYNLNRRNPPAGANWSTNSNPNFGVHKFSQRPMPRGRWVTYGIEVIMEDPGQQNGIARLYEDSVQLAELHHLQYGTDRGWAVRGITADDFWGGTPSQNPNPKHQQYYYAQYRIEATR